MSDWHPDMPQNYRDQILTGDCRDLAAFLPDSSIDLIICDPVYNEVWQYQWLAELAARVLEPGKSVIAETGAIYRFEAECAMFAAGLTRRPLITEVFTGGFRTIWKHRALLAGHHFIWLEKGEAPNTDRGWPRTTTFGSRDKTEHRWGDGDRVFLQILDWFTTPGDVVLDPFCGGGTVPVACVKTDRHYIGFELDAPTAERARARLAGVTPPLFVPEPAAHPALFEEAQP